MHRHRRPRRRRRRRRPSRWRPRHRHVHTRRDHCPMRELTPARRSLGNGLRSLGVAVLLVAAACGGNAPAESQPASSAGAARPAEASDKLSGSDVADGAATASTTAPSSTPPASTSHGPGEGTERTAAGLPVNPPRIATARARGASEEAMRVAEASPQSSGDEEEYVLFESRHVTARTGDCVWPAPGEGVVLWAEGFAPGSSVEVVQAGATAALVDLSLPALGSVRVDAAGHLEFVWTVPEAPAAEVDPVPRGYFVKATGTDASGEVLVARMWGALGVYPGTPPCAFDDAASTTVGEAVRIAVLGNDVAPSGGSWDATFVAVRSCLRSPRWSRIRWMVR